MSFNNRLRFNIKLSVIKSFNVYESNNLKHILVS